MVVLDLHVFNHKRPNVVTETVDLEVASECVAVAHLSSEVVAHGAVILLKHLQSQVWEGEGGAKSGLGVACEGIVLAYILLTSLPVLSARHHRLWGSIIITIILFIIMIQPSTVDGQINNSSGVSLLFFCPRRAHLA